MIGDRVARWSVGFCGRDFEDGQAYLIEVATKVHKSENQERVCSGRLRAGSLAT